MKNKMEDKAEKIKQRFEKRQEARIEELKKKKADAIAKTDENETTEAFNSLFAKETKSINEILESLAATGLNKAEIPSIFENIATKIQSMQKYITDSVIFLPSYEIQHAQAILQKLQTTIIEKREEILPRKKFSFKARAKVATNSEANRAKNSEEKSKVKMAEGPPAMETEKLFGFHDQKDSQLTITRDESKQQDVKLSNLDNCVVKIFGCPSALHVNNLKSCRILCGPISRPAFVSNCTDCQFFLACQQLRIHSTHKTIFNIHVTGKAIIEDCSGLGFSPFNWEYPNLEEDFLFAGLNSGINKWEQIDDFNWLKFDEHSPNWYTVSEEERTVVKET